MNGYKIIPGTNLEIIIIFGSLFLFFGSITALFIWAASYDRAHCRAHIQAVEAKCAGDKICWAIVASGDDCLRWGSKNIVVKPPEPEIECDISALRFGMPFSEFQKVCPKPGNLSISP